MKNIQDILAWCIEDIKAGRSTLEGCLAQYPSMRRQLEPLLRIALSIQEPPSIKPTNAFRIRARVQLMDYIHDKRSEKKSWITTLNTGIRQSWYSGWLKTVAIIIAIILASSASGTGTVYASKDSLPGDTLYSVKIATENVRRFLTIDDVAKIELELKLTGIRLEEIEDLANKNPERITLAVKGYEKNIAVAIDKAENNSDRGISAEGLEMVALAALEHISMLDGMEDSVPEAAKEAIRQAKEIAITEQVKALRSLAQQDPMRATEINIETMQNRLNRASTKADEREIMEAEDALRQFLQLRRFGEEISQIAKGLGYDTAAVDELNAQATHNQLEALGNMYGKISNETIAAIKEVVGISLEDYGIEDEASPGKGPHNDTPGEPGSGSGEPGNGSGEPGNGSP